MAFAPEVRTRVLAAIRAKLPIIGACPLCHTAAWTVADGFFVFPQMDTLDAGLIIGGPALPNVAIVCQTCGNTQFLNVVVLGLADLAPKAHTPPTAPAGS